MVTLSPCCRSQISPIRISLGYPRQGESRHPPSCMKLSLDRENSQKRTRHLLGAIMTTAGIGHFTFARKDFQAQVPDWFPMDRDFVVLASGVADVAAGAAEFFLPKQRKLTGLTLAAFYWLIYPGNIGQYAEKHSMPGLDNDRARLIRLFGQPALIAMALWSAGIPKK